MSLSTSTASNITTTQVEQALKRARATHARSIGWIEDHVARDGTPDGHDEVNGYYRVPWTLAVGGRPELAAASLEWISRHALTEDGDLRDGIPSGGFVASLASYPITQIALGAWLLERYDVANSVWGIVRSRLTDAESGGALAVRASGDFPGRSDLINTCQMGLTALTMGRTDDARRSVGWLRALWAAQPELPQRLYTSWQGGVLRTSLAEGETAWNLVTDFTLTKQQYYNPGIAAAFLARYAAQTLDRTVIPLAEELLGLHEGGIASQFDPVDNMQICKFAWGAGALLDFDGSPRALAQVLRMVDWYDVSQASDGSWSPSPFLNASPGMGDKLGKTAEHALHLTTIIRALGGELARR
jgi:hypothetical protein